MLKFFKHLLYERSIWLSTCLHEIVVVKVQQMDPAQRKRLADICEKLGVTLFAGSILHGLVVPEPSPLQIAGIVGILIASIALLRMAINFSKEKSQ